MMYYLHITLKTKEKKANSTCGARTQMREKQQDQNLVSQKPKETYTEGSSAYKFSIYS